MSKIDKLVDELKRKFDKYIINYTNQKVIYLRDLFYIFNYLLLKNEIEKIRNLVELLVHYQLNKPTYIEFIHGRGSPDYKYNWKQLSINNSNIGGFPTYIYKRKAYVFGKYPDIDTTSLSLAVISKSIDIFNDKKLYQKYRRTILNGFKYLLRRDVNKDGLLEQYENEDWMMSMLRCGAITYSNAVALLALDWIYDLTKKYDDIFNSEVNYFRKKLSKHIINMLYYNNYFIEGIDCYGNIIIRRSIDTIFVGFTSISESNPKVIYNHLKTIHKTLLYNNLLKNIDIIKKETNPNNITPGMFYNGGISTLYNLLYLYLCFKYNIDPAIDIHQLYSKAQYEWIDHQLRGYNSPHLPSIAIALYIYEIHNDKLR